MSRIDWRTVAARLRPRQDRLVDLSFLAGLAAIAAGCGWIYPPAAPIVGGLFLAGVAWQSGRAEEEDAAPAQRPVEHWYGDDTGDDD